MTDNGMAIPEALRRLEQQIGYRFKDPRRLLQAMTHSSFANEQADPDCLDNERLEFLGDAVLDLAVASCLLKRYPSMDEGALTRLRAEIVAETGLVRLARRLEIGPCLRLGRGESRSGGRDKASLLADATEALFGALFIDAGFARANTVITRLLEPLIDEFEQREDQDYKTRLQELLQGRQMGLPAYTMLEASGPAHQRRYRVEVALDGRQLGKGEGSSKKRAEQAAAAAALKMLSR